ncbi:MAG: ABC transporter substrate-binding protein [Bacteroidota bacterium]
MKILLSVMLGLAISAANAQNKQAKVSLVMPFCSKQIIANPQNPNTELGNLSREYYQGALIALDSFERAKIAIRLSVFDTENDSMTTVKITQKPSFKESELIIGPVRQGGNKVISVFTKKNEVYHVSPLMTFSKTKLDDPYWISANPDLPGYASILFKHIQSLDTKANIIVVTDKSTIGKSMGAAFKQLAADKKNQIRVVDYSSALDLTLYASSSLNNHIVVAATNESIINNVMRNIKDTTNMNGLNTYGLMQWMDGKNVDFALWQRCNTFFISPFFVDYTRPDVIAFIHAYREKFKTEPTEAAFKGYDQMMLFAGALNSYGKKFMGDLNEKPIKMLGTTYKFVKQKEGCYQNTYLNILHLNDFKLIPVN